MEVEKEQRVTVLEYYIPVETRYPGQLILCILLLGDDDTHKLT